MTLKRLVGSIAVVLGLVVMLPISVAHADEKSLAKVQKAAEKTFTTTAEFEGTVKNPNGVTTLEGSADYAADSSQLFVDASAVAGGVGMAEYRVIEGETIFVSIDAFGGEALPGAEGKSWVRIDLAAVQQLGAGFDFSDLLTDQAVFVDATDAMRVGTAKVDGKKAVRYKVTLAPDPGDVSQATEQEVWIRKGRIVRFRSMDIDPMGQPATSTITVLKSGGPVDIQAPPESEVYDLLSALPSQP